jgi:hypothetical protein
MMVDPEAPSPRFPLALLTILGLSLCAATLEAGALTPGGPLMPVASADTNATPLRFFAVGDLPYVASEREPLADLLAAAAARRPPFLVHVGDIKSGSALCTDENLRDIADLFRAQPVPMVYTPGDNEWTDCGRGAAGGLDPRERLARVREVFFGDPGVLRLAALRPISAGWPYPEIHAFRIGTSLVAALHVVGSNNGYDRDDPAALSEFSAREAANLTFLDRVSGLARAAGVRALVLIFQANPLFERSGPGPRGFRAFKERLVRLMGEFSGPVLVLHGDTHGFKHDRPLMDPDRGAPFPRLVRVEVPGSPRVGGVWITVDPDAPEPFAAEPVYALSLDALDPS